MFSTLIYSVRLMSFAVVCLAALPLANAAELRTYQFIPDQERLFSFNGGLLGIDVSAQLAGSFDVQIEDDGTSRLARFDVQLVDILDVGLYRTSWSDGISLAERLFVHPVGLTGQRHGAEIVLGRPDHIVVNEAVTSVTLMPTTDGLTAVSISSRPSFPLDNPAMSTRGPGLLARLVPEPQATHLLLLGLLVLPGCRRRRRPNQGPKAPVLRHLCQAPILSRARWPKTVAEIAPRFC